MKSILFFLLLFCSNLLIGQEFKDYFAITVVPQSPDKGYHIKLKDGCTSKDSATTDGAMRIRKRDSLVLSSFQRELSTLLRTEIIDKYHINDLYLQMLVTCNRDGVICDCLFSIMPKYIQYFPESLLMDIYTAFVAKVEPSLVSKIVNEFWQKVLPDKKRRTGHTTLLVSIEIDTERNQLGIKWPRHMR